MNTNTAPSSTIPVGRLAALDPQKGSFLALIVGLVGVALTGIAFFFEPTRAGLSSLIGISFWLSIALGMCLMVMLHHLFDAGWSTSIRRTLEHSLAVFPWLGLLFLPVLFVGVFLEVKGVGAIWKWTATASGYVAEDALYQHKSAYLNEIFFVLRTIFYFACWVLLAWALRKASFSQDKDGDARWTTMNRKVSAAGVVVVALTLTFAAIDWIKALDFHWFSTMFGVWFFSGSMRAALAATLVICVLLVKFGPFQGIFKQSHMYEIGRLMLAFTVFWAYIAFSQYFLIWNVNIPEVTFFYVAREQGQWWTVGLLLVFAYFLFPFVFLLFYRNKVRTATMVFISVWILTFHLIDLYFNILPSRMTPDYTPVYSMVSGFLLIDIAAFIGVGGICVWAFLRSFVTQKAIPVRDPRIMEAIKHHG